MSEAILITMLKSFSLKFKQYFCKHAFAVGDLKIVNPHSPFDDRVSWACDKCNKVFISSHGLAIAPKNGAIFRRNEG